MLKILNQYMLETESHKRSGPTFGLDGIISAKTCSMYCCIYLFFLLPSIFLPFLLLFCLSLLLPLLLYFFFLFLLRTSSSSLSSPSFFFFLSVKIWGPFHARHKINTVLSYIVLILVKRVWENYATISNDTF